jgi:plastocyanin
LRPPVAGITLIPGGAAMSMRRVVLILSIASATGAVLSCGGRSSPMSPSEALHIIVIRGNNASFSFDPVNEVIQVGQSVAWRNEDSMTHAIVDGNGLLRTGNIGPGATSGSVTLSAPATIQYHCSIHPSMKGLVSVNP